MNWTRAGITRACLIAFSVLALAACDDSGGEENTDTSTSTGGDMTTSTNGDMTTSDPDGTTTSTDDATTTDPGDTTTTPDTTIDPGEPLDITWPASPEDYVANTSLPSYVTSLQLPPTVDGIPTCCRDFGPISKDYIDSEGASNEVDNALGELVNGLSFAPDLDVNALIQEQIEEGTVVVLWDHVEHNGMATDPDDFVLVGLLGEFTNGTTYQTAAMGAGEFNVTAGSFVEGGTPLINFNPAAMEAGAMTAGPSTFVLSLPLLGADLNLTISEALVAGTASLDPAVGYTEGTLSGYILVEEVFAAVNNFLASPTCECLGLTGDVYTYVDGTGAGMCLDPADAMAACPDAEQEICVTLATGQIMGIDACALLPGLITSTADIDVDGDCQTDPDECVFDAISVGLVWEGAAANVVGNAAPAP